MVKWLCYPKASGRVYNKVFFIKIKHTGQSEKTGGIIIFSGGRLSQGEILEILEI